MNVLGIHDGHNASAALLMDGSVRAAVQEERISRAKNFHGCPTLAIASVLRQGDVSWKDVDVVAVQSQHMPRARGKDELRAHFASVGRVQGRIVQALRRTPLYGLHRARRRAERLHDLRMAGVPLDKVRFVEHHDAHAAAAYFGSPWRDDVLVLTCDGAGDGLCATVSTARGDKISRIASVPESESLGNVYGLVTFLLGMVPNEHEYKLMGMAPYAPDEGAARSRAVFDELIEFPSATAPVWSRQAGVPPTYYSLEWLRSKLAYHRFDWICAGLQGWLEDTLVEWVRRAIAQTGIRKLALGGGVFMNVKANQRIMSMPELENLFVFPSCGDESNAIGAAFATASQSQVAQARENDVVQPIRDVYWGESIDEEDAANAVRTVAGIAEITRLDDIESAVADLLASGEIVARCKGRMEFGARALGNRSILADPGNPGVVRVINDMIKNRDFWMPFASSVLSEELDQYFVNPKAVATPYMILAFDSTPRIKEFAAGAHPYDLTVRPQAVYRDWNPEYHLLISRFRERTGKGIILNTSLNLHGYPMVATAADAVDVFARSGLAYLALGQYLLKKRTAL